jgi:ABC-type uncharacterized transport system involved in gliding motility auxiliary subunit
MAFIYSTQEASHSELTQFSPDCSYLVAQENLIGIEPRTYDLPRLNMTNRQLKGTFFLSVILMPAVLALLGLVVWWRQR